MSLKCRVFRDEKGQIDFVTAENGNRSKLFDKLVDITGGNKNTALNIYALTEVDELKGAMVAKLNAFKERFKNIVKVAPAEASINFSRVRDFNQQEKDYKDIMEPLKKDFYNMQEEVKALLAESKIAYKEGNYRKGAALEKETLKVTTAFQDKHGLAIRYGQITGRVGAPENLSQFRGGRGTGHFGSGFYFTGVEESDLENLIKETTDLENLGRTKVILDFNKYNLLRVRDNEEGLELHEALKSFAGGVIIDEDTDFTKIVYKDILDSEGEKGGLYDNILEALYDTAVGSLGAGKFNEKFIEENGENFDKNFEVDWIRGSGKDYFLGQLSTLLSNALRSEASMYTERNNISDVIEMLPDSFSENLDTVIREEAKIPKSLDDKESFYFRNFDKAIERLSKAIVKVDSSKNYNEVVDTIKNKYKEIYKDYLPYNVEKSQKQTTIGTQILKELGYNGIDVRGVGESAGTTAMDNTTFGSVIYDIYNTKDGSEPFIKEFLGTEDSARFSKNQGQEAPRELLDQVIDRLEQSGLANNVYKMTNAQIEAKLVELGVSAEIAKQIVESRIADQLPLTLAVFDRKEFRDLQGKEVNPITVLNSLNQSGIKQIERDLIKQIIEDNYPGQKKISYDELETTVRANIMPLERITTSSYADYGMDNLGNGNYGEAKTLIFNAPINHGVTGHFPGDFKASGRQNIKYQAKQLNDNTWVAVEEGYQSQANNNNIYEFVGTAGTKESVDNWIKDYNVLTESAKAKYTVYEDRFFETRDYATPSKVIKGFDTSKEAEQFIKDNQADYEGTLDYLDSSDIENNINKGMFGHIRVWENTERDFNLREESIKFDKQMLDKYGGEWQDKLNPEEKAKALDFIKRKRSENQVFYVAEMQSDYFQKNNARKNILGKNKEYIEADIKKSNAIEEADVKKSISVGVLTKGFGYSVTNIQGNRVIQKSLNSFGFPLGENSGAKIIQKNDTFAVEFEGKILGGNYYLNKDRAEEALLTYTNKENYSKTKEQEEVKREDIPKDLLEDYDYVKTGFLVDVKQAEKIFNSEVENIIKNLSPQEKQFIASQKEWEKRMVREAIKEAALSGATSLRFPTPYTLSVIEGYVSRKKSGEAMPYTIMVSKEDGVLNVGDSVDYINRPHLVVSSSEDGVGVLEQEKMNAIYSYDEFKTKFGIEPIKNTAVALFSADKTQAIAEQNEYNALVDERNGIIIENSDKEGITKEELENKVEPIRKKLEEAFANLSENIDKGTNPNTYVKINSKFYNPSIYEFTPKERYVYDTITKNVYVFDSNASLEYLGQPSSYKVVEDEKGFNISDLSDTQQTVARKYEEIASILEKEKPTEIVTDENGFDWYEAKITPEDTQNPVVAFQKQLGRRDTRLKVIKEALKIDAYTPEVEVANYFLSGGRVSEESIKKLYRNSKGEVKARMSLISKTAPSINQIAHSLWENSEIRDNDGESAYTDQDYVNFIEELLSNNNTRKSIAEEVLRPYQIENNIPEEDYLYLLSDEYIESQILEREEFERLSSNGVQLTTAGFTYKGDVYLNTDAMGLDTPIHEFGHLHLDWLKENRNDLYKSGLSLIGKNKEEAQQYIDIVKETQPDLKEGTEKFNNEVLAQVIGDQGAKLVQSKEEQSIADWLISVWESIKDVLGLTSYTAEQVANMTLAEFGTASATEMLSGSRIQRGANTTNSDINFSVLSDYRDNNRFAYSDLIYPDVVFKDINKPQDVKTATNFYKKIIAKFNKTFDRDLKIETSEKSNDFKVTVEYETGLRPKYFAYPTAVMGEHSTVNDIDKNVPLTSLRHELIHEMLVKNITDKFERINNLDNSANIESIEEVQRNRAYNYTLEDVFFERVVENIERNPDNKDTFEVSTFGTDVINALKKELGDEAISKEKVISTLKTLLEGSNYWLSSTLLEIFENRLDYNVEDLSDLADSLGEKFKTKFVASKDIFSKELQEKINDFTKFFNEEYTGVLTRLNKQKAKPQDIVSGNKLFNEPLEEAAIIANEYIAEKNMDTTPIQKITKLDKDNSKRIAEEFDKMEVTPNNSETKAAYKAMVDETLEQYEKILSKGYKIEINNLEPYSSSADMIKDLRENKSMRIFSTESGFGDEPITGKQRKENPLLEETQYKDINGGPLLANDIFRFVHDFFGHAKFGNGFGAIGEENAWNVHSRMYSPLARRAMTTETRGQNSWVNFSGVNDEAFKKRDRARVLRQQGKLEEAAKLTEEVYEEMSFAEQKVGLLPEWVSTPYEQSVMETAESTTTTPIETRQPSLEVDGVKVFAKERVNPITGENMGDIELELIESTERNKGNARKAAEVFLNGTDAQGKDVYLTISPRDKQTSPERLESFYSSLGFQKTSDFEMVRKARPVSLKDTDSNGEPSIKILMNFSNSKVKPLGVEGLKAAKNAAMALKVKSSQELVEKMEKALMKNGIVLFDKLSLQRSRLYNTFEINTILTSPKLQKQIKESLLALRNSEPFSIEYDENFIVPQGREVNQFGKQDIINPNVAENELLQSIAGLKESEIDEALPAAFSSKYYTDSNFRETVDTIARDYKKVPIKSVVEEELIDKTEDVEGMLINTITDDENDTISEDIRFLREDIDEEIFNSSLRNISRVLNKIKRNAYVNGIDLRNLPTLALELSRSELLGFLDSMEDAIIDPTNPENFREFTERYYNILGDKEVKTEVIKSNSENDLIVEEPLSEYEMFSKFGLVKKDEGVYRQVKEESLDTLYENFFDYKNLVPEDIETLEDLKTYVQKNASLLEVSDYEVDVDNLEKIFLYKKFFEFPMSTQTARVKVDSFNKITNSEEYLTDDFVKDFNKWILETTNPYFKVTGKGIELVNNDELSKIDAVNSVPEKFKQELAEYNIISDSLNLEMPLTEEKYEDINTQLEQRQKAVNNPDRVKKVSGQYTYLKDGVLAVKNESETFVKTPIGIFEKIFEFENIKFYGKLDTDKRQGYKKVSAEAPFSDINFKDYTYLAATPDSFKTSKNYYSRNELNEINDEYFGCQ